MVLGMMFALTACGNAADADGADSPEISAEEDADARDADESEDAEDADGADGEAEDGDSAKDADKEDEKAEDEKPGTTDKSLLKPYLGSWEYDDGSVLVAFEADFTWRMYDGTAENKFSTKLNSGTFTVDEERVYLFDKEDEFVISMESNTSNYLTDSNGVDIYRYIAN